MKYVIVSIKDALKGYAGLNLVENENVAIRDFTSAVNGNEMIKKNFGDFSLYMLGSYETKTGVIDTKECPKLLVSASDVKYEVEK